MNRKIVFGLAALAILVLASLAFSLKVRVPEPDALRMNIRPPLTASSATTQAIRPARAAKPDCSCPDPDAWFSLQVRVGVATTYREPPIASFRITDQGSTDQIKVVRSSGSSVVDRDLTEQIARRSYASLKGCGGWRVTVTPLVEFTAL